MSLTPPIALSDHQRAILAECLARPGLRRSDLSEALGISAQTTMRAVLPLIDAGVLSEKRVMSGSRGKPAGSLNVVPGAMLTLGISLASDRVRAKFADLSGEAVFSRGITATFESAETQLAALDRLLEEGLANLPQRARLVGIGVSVQGYFLERGKRLAARSDPEGWAAVDLEARLAQRFAVPVRLMNDGKTLASSMLLTARHDHFICLHLGTGIGGGIVSDRSLILGANGNAGEIGSLFPKGPERPVEPSFLRHTGLTDWQDWKGIDAIAPDARRALLAFIEAAGTSVSRTLEQALALLDYEAVFICSRMPQDLLQRFCESVSIAPLGTDLVGKSHNLRNPAPKVHARHVRSYAHLAGRMALDAFLTPSHAAS